MPSPFPGMDPYLEISGDWRDFHARFLNACADTLSDRLPEGYIAASRKNSTFWNILRKRCNGGIPMSQFRAPAVRFRPLGHRPVRRRSSLSRSS